MDLPCNGGKALFFKETFLRAVSYLYPTAGEGSPIDSLKDRHSKENAG